MLDPFFFFISRLNNACSPLVINLRIKDIPLKSFQLWAENFGMVDIKIKTPGFTKPKIILIRIRYPRKKLKI